MKTRLTLLWLLAPLALLCGDVVNTRDGARLVGTITTLSEGVLTLETAYAGTLEIDMAQVESFSTDDPISLRLENGDTVSGTVQSGAGDNLRIANASTSVQTSVEDVRDAWPATQTDPEILKREEELKALQRKWSYSLAASIDGSSGNTDKSDFSLRGEAKLEGPNDTLLFYGRYTRSEAEGITTDDETIGGIRFDSFVYQNLGWYARIELENDPFENLDLRTVVAGGLTYRFLNQDHHSLVGRLGAAYRYRSFTDGTDSEEPTLDLGLTHRYVHNDFWSVDTEVTFDPSFEDFSDYLASYSSVLQIPLPNRFWNLGLGLTADYTSEPPAGIDEFDYTWFAALILNWD